MEMPLQVICEMLGVPDEDRQLDLRLEQHDGRLPGPVLAHARRRTASSPRPRSTRTARRSLADAAPQGPADDIMTALVNAEVDGDRLTHRRAQHVLRDPRRRRQRDDAQPHRPLRAGAASSTPRCRPSSSRTSRRRTGTPPTEEFLRWGTSIHNFRRTAMVDTELARPAHQGRRQGRRSSTRRRTATRSEFDDPTRSTSAARPNDHLTFGGGGAHFCLGANLARVEIKAMVREFLRRYPNVELAGEHRAHALGLRQRHQPDADAAALRPARRQPAGTLVCNGDGVAPLLVRRWPTSSGTAIFQPACCRSARVITIVPPSSACPEKRTRHVSP